ncbi:MAG: ornithine cyclodeaminase family protein [Woeseiaceae bacterium]|nr:ornithine cyclodeaminase family protein [Woeseiaceae bacterium]
MDVPFVDSAEVAARTPWPALIDAIRDAFRRGGESPVRHQHVIPAGGDDNIDLLLMPAWRDGGDFGIKIVALARANAARGLPTLHGLYLLFDGTTGVPRALLDAGSLTARRTAAASALASRSLSREDSSTLLMIGTGRVARNLIAAHCAVRPIKEVRVWGRSASNAEKAADEARRETGVACVVVADVAEAAAGADIISSAVPTEEPLLKGAWIQPGTHVDLVGAFKPTMCEADPEVIARATVYVDTMDGAKDEAGDLIQATDAGVFSWDKVAGDLVGMAAAEKSLRQGAEEITLFKSVGSAVEDLAAAELCLR